MTREPPVPEIATRVARAYWEDHAFQGQRIFRDLIGRVSMTGMLGLALTGRRLSEDDCAFIDDILVALTVADPRIWPLKIGRIVASYGRFIPGFTAGFLSIDGASVGPVPSAATARALRDVFDAVGGRVDDGAAVERALEEKVRPLPRIGGFGVPFRPVDERVVALSASARRRGRDTRPYWRLFEAMTVFVRRERKLEPNADAVVATALLDMGFEGKVLDAMAASLFLMTFVANAMEGSAQPAAALRALPLDRVDRPSVGPRESPAPSRDEPPSERALRAPRGRARPPCLRLARAGSRSSLRAPSRPDR